MWNTLVDNWYWFGGILAVAFLFRQFRLYVLRKKKEREENKPSGGTYTMPKVEVTQDFKDPPIVVPDPLANIPAPVYTPPPRNEVEDFYAKEKAAWEKRQEEAAHLIALANQKAQFEMVQHGKCVRLTAFR